MKGLIEKMDMCLNYVFDEIMLQGTRHMIAWQHVLFIRYTVDRVKNGSCGSLCLRARTIQRSAAMVSRVC